MDNDSDFHVKLTEYLENSHVGEFLTGTQDEVLNKLSKDSQRPGYIDPTDEMPSPPPDFCKKKCGICSACQGVSSWWDFFRSTVDRIIALSNIHTCHSTKKKDGTQNKRRPYLGCLDNIWKKCKAWFPRALFEMTVIDFATGTLNMKKHEPWTNTVTPLLFYIFRCNTDVTNLRSGTALKGVILYMSDYVTKVALKTHVVFDVIKVPSKRT